MENLILNSLFSFLLPFVPKVFAYIDPGTGSIILQAIIGGLVGAAIAVKLFWHRILKFLGLRKGKTSNVAEEEGEDK